MKAFFENISIYIVFFLCKTIVFYAVFTFGVSIKFTGLFFKNLNNTVFACTNNRLVSKVVIVSMS